MPPAAPSYCRPYTASWFAVDNAYSSDGISAEIRHFGWIRSCGGSFRANATYIDHAFGLRSPASRTPARAAAAYDRTGRRAVD